jgi:hypothetical protein
MRLAKRSEWTILNSADRPSSDSRSPELSDRVAGRSTDECKSSVASAPRVTPARSPPLESEHDTRATSGKRARFLFLHADALTIRGRASARQGSPDALAQDVRKRASRMNQRRRP